MRATRRTRDMVAGFLRAALIGLCGGLASLLFRSATVWVQKLVGIGADILEGARSLPTWELVLIPTCGALFAALVHRVLVSGAAGTGLSDVMEAVSLKSGAPRLKNALARALSSLGIIATGGSVGREGPIITISAAASSELTRLLRAPARDRGLLLGCGVAAGFAAAYNAPIAGALFALEVVLGNFAMELFAPVVVASVTSTLFTWYIRGGHEPIYVIPQFEFISMWELLPYLFLGLAAGFVAVGFQKMLTMSERIFTAIPGPRVAKTMTGGLLIGILAIWFPEVWGNGYESVSELLTHQPPRFENVPWVELTITLGVLSVVKAVGTSLTVGSGGAGGVFTPTLFIGAGLGGAVGVLVNHYAPHQAHDYGGYALVGMGCLVAGTTRAPIMAILVMYEMTRNYDIVLPLMLGCITASLVARTLYEPSIYTEKLRARGVKHPVGLEETVLVTTRVADVMRSGPLTWVGQAMTYAEIVPLATSARAAVVFVCDEQQRVTGAVRVHDLIELASMGDLGPGIVAADLSTPIETVTPSHSLADVFDIYERSDVGTLPVVDEKTERLVAVVARRDVMAALHIEVLKRHNLRAKFVHREDEQELTDYVELPKGVELARVPVLAEHENRTLGECRVRIEHQVTVLCVIRRDQDGNEMRFLPDGEFVMHGGDELIVMGDADAVTRWREVTEEDA